jgi:RNA polymerase sigma-70 factor (ECF subfamily)
MRELVLTQPIGVPKNAEVAEPSAKAEALSRRSATDGNAARVETGDVLRAEFERLLDECGPLAYRVARSVLRNDADAQDIAQEALLRAYRRFHRLRDSTRFRGWLVRIAFRLALDRVRAAKRREVRETLWAQPAPSPSVEDLAASNEFQARLERAIDELPGKFRLVLLLTAMRGQSMEEVASTLGLPLGTVKSRLFFARKKLAEKLRCFVNDTKKR